MKKLCSDELPGYRREALPKILAVNVQWCFGFPKVVPIPSQHSPMQFSRVDLRRLSAA
jgi:hypothetical protein